MESILEEDEHQLKDNPGRQGPDEPLVPVKTKMKLQTSLRGKEFKGPGSNGSTTMSQKVIQTKNDHELSTAQTSGGFSNTRRSPRDPSFESSNMKNTGDKQLRLRPQLMNSQNYASLHQIRY